MRYGNVMGSRGSVIPFFLEKKKTGTLPITDPRMTRFNISLQDGVEMVMWAIQNAWGGEVLVPKIPSYRITDVATAIAPECVQNVIGIRPGEKIHEEMITASDSASTVDLGKYYAMLPATGAFTIEQYCSAMKAKLVAPGFAYDSGSNPDYLSIEQLRDLISACSSGEH